MTPGEWAAFLGTVGGLFGLRELIPVLLKRRQDRSDARDVHRGELAKIDANDKSELTNRLLGSLEDRITGYRADIDKLREQHELELGRQSGRIMELERENRELDRRLTRVVEDLQQYRMGARVPRGMVLVPLTTVRVIRQAHPELLPAPWYVGEDEDVPQPGRSIVAEITPLGPSSGEQPRA